MVGGNLAESWRQSNFLLPDTNEFYGSRSNNYSSLPLLFSFMVFIFQDLIVLYKQIKLFLKLVVLLLLVSFCHQSLIETQSRFEGANCMHYCILIIILPSKNFLLLILIIFSIFYLKISRGNPIFVVNLCWKLIWRKIGQ